MSGSVCPEDERDKGYADSGGSTLATVQNPTDEIEVEAEGLQVFGVQDRLSPRSISRPSSENAEFGWSHCSRHAPDLAQSPGVYASRSPLCSFKKSTGRLATAHACCSPELAAPPVRKKGGQQLACPLGLY